MKKLIDLYIYRIGTSGVEYLLLKRSKRKIYAGQWRMIGGKVEDGETRPEAALREMQEETGLQPARFWALPSINHFYEAETDQIHLIPAFAAEVGPDAEPSLDEEHSEFEWVMVDEAVHRLYWPEQKRLVRTIEQILSSNQWLDSWNIPLD